MSTRAVVITGSNLGDREQNLSDARRLIGERVGDVVADSGVYESEPWGEMSDGGGPFLNQVLVVETSLEPLQLLESTQRIECMMGRTQKGDGQGRRSYVSRVIDIDILYYGECIVRSERLTIPHPLLTGRKFVLVPLAEVLPRMKHPVTGKTSEEMLSELKSKLDSV